MSDQETLFKLDTGAEVTAVSEETYEKLGKPTLNAPGKMLYGPSRHPLRVLGQFHCDLSHKRKSTTQPVFVVEGLKSNLLGLPAIVALSLAARLDTVADLTTDFQAKFPKVFKGLGSFKEEYEIKLKPNAELSALYTPRHVPLPLRPKVTEELTKMEQMGVISKVDQPIQWCTGMVVVPKKSGKLRICVDLKPLNRSVL